jgi:thiosulfate/3-mercaptopyruvate sulfurtransferase
MPFPPVVRVLAAVAALAMPTQAQKPRSLLVSTTELAERLASPTVVVLHIGDRRESFEQGHIPGARFVAYLDVAVDGPHRLGTELPSSEEAARTFAAAGVSDGSHVVIYGTNPVVAARAFFTLDALGHRNVALLDGGVAAWRAENRPVETGPGNPVRAGMFTPRLHGSRIVDATFVQRAIGTAPASIALIDVRGDPEFLGTDSGHGGAHRPGHIPGAQQLPWNARGAKASRI